MTAGAPKLKREIGMLGLTSITVGGIIGSGIFALAATMGSTAGPAALIALLFLGVIVVLLALPYAELSAAYPITGGPYSLPRRALGNFGGFLIGWGYFLYAFIGTAAIIDVFVEYLGTYVGHLTSTSGSGALVLTVYGVGVALVFLAGYTLLNIAGAKWGSAFAIVTTFSKLIPLVLFGLIGLLFLRVGNFTAFGLTPFGWTGVAFAMSLGFFAFTGFEAATIPAEEVRNPKRTLPRATILSVGIVTAIYALVAVAFLGGIRWISLGIAPGDWGSTGSLLLNNVAGAWGLPLLGTIVVAGAILSTLGAGGDWVLLQGRMPYAMARDNLFFRSMARIHPRFGTPVVALTFASVLTGIVLIALPSFPEVALVASITTLLPYGAAALALLVLRRTDPTTERPYRLPYATILTPLAFVFATVLIYWASWPWTLVGVLLMLVGVPLYFLFTLPEFRGWAKVVELVGAAGGLAVVGLALVFLAPAGGTLLGVAAAPLLGSLLLFVGIPAYFVTLLLRRTTYQESKGILWIVTYLAGLGVISYIGDQFFIFDNFLQPPSYPITLQPMGLLTTPYDLVVLVVFGLGMFAWGYFSALPRTTPHPADGTMPRGATLPEAAPSTGRS
ncbi:MAG: APC family permease [Thermoplasmata archaeon]|nr:APC family permease [Thermoplasmata archaeon]MCI4361820.1 APC family permease [Thermoplasmata archaeon]